MLKRFFKLWRRRKVGCFCLTTGAGAVDIFREVRGLEQQFERCYSHSIDGRTASGTPYRDLSDLDMLRCQEALEPGSRNEKRVNTLRAALKNGR